MANNKNTQFSQLMLAENGELTFEQRQFIDLHKQICYNAQSATESFVGFVQNVRKMKEERLYQAAGYTAFEEYTEDALHIKQRQAYYYVSIAEKLPESFLQGHASLGVTKLALLTSIDASEREELMERINLEQTSVRGIEAEIKAITAERDEATKQLSIMTEAKAAVEKEKEDLQQELHVSELSVKDLLAKNKKLEKQLKEAPTPEVVFQPDLQTVSELQEAQKRNKELEEEDGKKAARISELEEKLKAKAERNEKKKSADLEAAERKLKEMAAELEEAKAKKTTIADDSLLTFKVKFGDLQRLGGEISTILNSSDEETADKLRNAMRAVLTKWQEDMKL